MTLASRFGPRPLEPGGYEFRLWAPGAKSVQLVTRRAIAMTRDESGWFRAQDRDARVGSHYRFRIDGATEIPDPASAFQPEDVSGPSEIVDHRFAWQAARWRGRPWHEAIILEIHVGTFSQAGTFRSAIERLDDVANAGFTAIELMPVADFFGRWNWGYDGVLWFAPDSSYGRPEDLKALVDAAHARGLMMFLDVVYNHFGPEGNYLGLYAPEFFDAERPTPWGAAIDYSVPEVRAFVIENAIHWLDHYRFDGLRLDAVHALAKRGTPSILEDISKAAGEFARASGRQIHLVIENDHNDAALLDPSAEIPAGKYRAQWNDDYHHAWHVLLTGESAGYYQDYAANPARDIARALQAGFVYQGEASAHRKGAPRGTPSAHLPSTAFVNFLQNHDQIGNRAHGERLDALADPAAIEAALTVTLLMPGIPLMFMGEEWGERRPFPFFCDFRGDLAKAVREGRQKEFAFAGHAEARPDPLSELTFSSSAIDWSAATSGAHGARRDLVRRLLACRARHITPRLARLPAAEARAEARGPLVSASWRLDGGLLHLAANLSDEPVSEAPPPGRRVWNEPSGTLAPWFVLWTWED